MDTAAKVGIESKKEIFTESNLLKLSNLAAVIVIPDLLTPGIKDIAWKNPIINADLKLKLVLISFSNLNLSLIYNKIPKIIVIHAITFIFLISSIKLVWTKMYPINITGIEDIIIFMNSSLFLKKLEISL